jgi:hypothetical protein
MATDIYSIDDYINRRAMYFTFLDDLRESGETNMFGAIPYLQEEFNINRETAQEVLVSWMNAFEKKEEKVNETR